jgi:hypothetical protein
VAIGITQECLGGDDMNEIKIVKANFDFLINHGFSYSYEKDSYICFTLEYQKGDIIIIPGYDFREHDFSVYLRDVNNKNAFDLHVNILETKIGTLESRTKLEQSVKIVFIDSEKYKHGMPKKHFESIVTLYADFVKENLNDILNWKY